MAILPQNDVAEDGTSLTRCPLKLFANMGLNLVETFKFKSEMVSLTISPMPSISSDC